MTLFHSRRSLTGWAVTAVMAIAASLLAAVVLSVPARAAAAQCSTQAQQKLSDYGPIPAPGSPVPGSPECFTISIPPADGGSGASQVLHVNAGHDPQAGDGVAISPVAQGAAVGGEAWTLITQGTSGSYWTAGTSYLLQSYQTNLCLQGNGAGKSMVLGSCDDSPTVFNITAVPGSPEFVDQIATGVFAGGKSLDCLSLGAPKGTFAPCDSTNAGQQWTFGGQTGWLTKSQIESANAGTCPVGGTGASCEFTPDTPVTPTNAVTRAARTGEPATAVFAAARTTARANRILQTNMCATDQLGNPLDAYHAPPGLSPSGGSYYSATFGGTLTTTSAVNSSISGAIAFSLANSFEQQKTSTTGISGLVTALTTVYDLKTITTTTQFTVTGQLGSSYSLATGAQTSVSAAIATVPPGDYAWFSVHNTFAAVAGHIAVPSKRVGNYSIPVPNFVLPTLPGAGQPANSSQVPTTIKQGLPGTGGIIDGHYATEFRTVSPADCSPPTPSIKSGETYQVDNAATVLSLSGGGKCASGTGVVQSNYGVTRDEKWKFVAAGKGLYTLTNQCGLRLTDPNSSNQTGLAMTQSAATGSSNQLWRVTAVYGSDSWNIQSYASGLWLSVVDQAVGSPVTQNVAAPVTGDEPKILNARR
jgi:hypothetical protein